MEMFVSKTLRMLACYAYSPSPRVCFSLHISTRKYHQGHNSSSFTPSPTAGILFSGGLVCLTLAAAKAKEHNEDANGNPSPIISPFVLATVDQLYEQKNLAELEDLLIELCERYPKNDEVLWRLARCRYEQGKKLKLDQQKQMTEKAHEIVSEALVINDNNFNAHRWKAILSNSQSEAEGMKAHIINLETMRYHLERAVELNPVDGTSWTLLGIWYFGLVELTWYERKLANTFLGKIPDASYEQALEHVLKAEEMAPLNWNKNMLLIGKIYLRMKDYKKAVYYLETTLKLEVVTDEDLEVLAEAKGLLKECQNK